MQLKTKLAAAGIGALASGGAFATMLSGTASAAPIPAVLTQASQANTNSGTTVTGGAQSGDQAAPDNATKGSESASSEADGPGGHQDAGNATDVNHQFQGQE